MEFSQAIRIALKEKYATFSGRARRSEYWWFMLFFALAYFALGILAMALLFATGIFQTMERGGDPSGVQVAALILVAVLAAVIMLGLILPMISVSVRRLHDHGRSGWWWLLIWVLSIVPILGYLVSIGVTIYFALRGTPGPNKFGPDPLAANNSAEVFR